MSNAKHYAVAVMRVSLVVLTAFTLAVALRVVGGDRSPRHPAVAVEEECSRLPPGHPPVDGEMLPGLPPGHPPVRVQRLPPGHPPVDEARPAMPLLPQDGTSTI
jgi:hypothetical protein